VTIIAYCGKYIAADSLEVWGEYRNYDAVKIDVIDNTVFASCGIIALFEPMIEWYLAGADPTTCPAAYREELTTELLVISPKVFYSDSDKTHTLHPAGHCVATNNPFRHRIPTPFASGCMNDFAMGAMAAGADAVEAVHLSCMNGTHAAAPVRFVDLHKIPYVVQVGTDTTRKQDA
jgi:hypothetical protein